MATPLDYESELRAALAAEDSLTVSPDWEGIAGTAFGGFVAGAALLAAAGRSALSRPLSLFVRFFRPVPIGSPVSLALASERRGRSLESSTGSVSHDGRLLASFSVAFGADREVPVAAQSVPVMPPLVRARPVWQFLEEEGIEPGRMMRRVGFRGETDESGSSAARGEGWHLACEWPASASPDPVIQAAVSLMAIDCFVAPATMKANGVTNENWPVTIPTLDLAGWFYAPEDGRRAGDWLRSRTSVPVTHAGHAVGRTQVWAGDRIIAEGMSQVALVPVARP